MGLRIFCKVGKSSWGTVPWRRMLFENPRGAHRSRGCRSFDINSYVRRPSENMSDSSPHLAGMAHISGAEYFGGGSALSCPALSVPVKAKGESTCWPHCTPLSEQ